MGAAERTRRVTSLIMCAVSLLTSALPARAIGVRYPDAVESATGVREDMDVVSRPHAHAWSFEVSERELFGGVGLRVVGARCAFVRAHWRAGVEAAEIAADVGSERRAALRVAALGASWSAELGVTGDVAAIADLPDARLTALDVRTRASLSPGVRVGCDVEGLRVAGIESPGADVVTSIVVTSSAGAAVTSSFVVHRFLGAYACIGASLRLAGCAAVMAGYDDGSGELSLAVSVSASGARAVALATMHPVLGLSRGASVGWSR